MLSTRQPTAYPGPYRVSTTPYLFGICDALKDDAVWLVVIEAGAQTGKTMLAYVWQAEAIINDPGPFLVVYPSEDIARSQSQTRVMPMWEDSPVLSDHLPVNRRDHWTALQYRFRGCVVNWAGSNSPAQLASRPIRYALLDEVDKWPRQARDEADPVNLAIQRTKTFWNRKVFMASTPTVPDGAIHRAMSRGDIRRYHVPCHACGGMQVLEWKQIKFDSAAPPQEAAAGAHYQCAMCGAHWADRHKIEAIAHGEWRGSKEPTERGVASFHLPSLYAPWVTWSGLVAKFLGTRDKPIELQDFINSELAEPFLPVDMSVRDETLRARELDYADGKCPMAIGGIMAEAYTTHRPRVFGGVDVQQGYMVAVFREFADNGDSAQVWRGRIGSFAELDMLAARFNAAGTCIDLRYRSQDVYEACLRYDGFWPAIGRGAFSVPGLWEFQTRFPDEGRKRGGSGRRVTVVVFDTNTLATMLADRVDALGHAPNWYLPHGASADAQYVREMTAQVRVNGVWVNPSKRDDHFFDAEKLSILAAEVAGYKVQDADGNAAPKQAQERAA